MFIVSNNAAWNIERCDQAENFGESEWEHRTPLRKRSGVHSITRQPCHVFADVRAIGQLGNAADFALSHNAGWPWSQAVMVCCSFRPSRQLSYQQTTEAEGGLADETELLLVSSNQVWGPFTGL